MTMDELLSAVKAEFDLDLIKDYDGFIAVQTTITGEPNGVFYAEVKDHELHIEPYDYYDRNAAITISADNLINILKGKLDPVIAFTVGKLKVEGDPGKVLELLRFTKKSRARKASK
ncbi:MAG: SCP2 sterol-binding domain-containing protein [Lachnospiraceae bacterium]|nr:SCP2 sterol-binding domain-containing protein [Lachnospiraceae bacterium]